MVIERYRNGDPKPVYARFAAQGRMMPAGLSYRGSWVSADGSTCFQIMECADQLLLEQWMAAWRDLVDFEVTAVITSEQAAVRFK